MGLDSHDDDDTRFGTDSAAGVHSKEEPGHWTLTRQLMEI